MRPINHVEGLHLLTTEQLQNVRDVETVHLERCEQALGAGEAQAVRLCVPQLVWPQQQQLLVCKLQRLGLYQKRSPV
jgi:hypothetical protein